MPLIMLLLLAAWTLIVFRLLCFRATVGARTVVTWLALGAAAGPLATALTDKFFNSYSWTGTYYFILIDVLRVFVLIVPVLLLLSRSKWRWGSSVADAFLAAFVVGFGYDMVGPVITSAGYEQLNSLFSFLPPGTVSQPTFTIAGYGYWCGLCALAFAAGMRFGRNRIVAYVTGTAALIFAGSDIYFDFVSADQVPAAMMSLTLHRSLTPWLVIGLLIAASVMERAWQGKGDGKSSFFAELQAVMMALISLKPHEAARLGALHRLRRQNALVQAELKRSPADKALQRYAIEVVRLLQRAEASRPFTMALGAADAIRWLRLRAPQLAIALGFVVLCLVFSMPSFRSIGTPIWTSMPLAQPLVPFQQNLITMMLVPVTLWYFLIAPVGASSVRTDEMAEIAVERRLLQAGIAVSLVTLLYPVIGELFDFNSALALASGLNLRNSWNGLQLNTLALFLISTACGLTIARAERWHHAPQEARSRAAAHNLVVGFRALALAWIGFNFFVQLQAFIHGRFGPGYFNRFGRNGNSLAELTGGLVTALFIYGMSWVLQLVADRAESFLAGEPPPAVKSGKTKAATAAAHG